jgi:adenylate cyclase
MEEDEVTTVRTLEQYRAILSGLVEKHGGRVVDSPGDNLLAQFTSVVDAMEAAVEIQKELEAKNADLPENRRMEFRIGINLGDVIAEGERIYGDGVNIAARVESLSDSGGICVSGTAFDQIAKKLPLGYEYLGEQTVKNIEKPVRVYRVLMDPEAAGKVIGEKRPISRHWRWAAVAMIVVAGALAIWNFYIRPPFEPASVERMAFQLPDKPSIAVLPFTNISGDPEQEYFSDGLTEEIITALSKIPRLFVIARNSTFSYKGKSVKVNQVAEELGVRYVLEGSVRKTESRVRITAQLIDAVKGHHLWAERYERELKDIFAIQDEITKEVITGLRVQLTDGEQAARARRIPWDLDAYLKFLQGREYWVGFNREDNIRARKVAEEIISLDPNHPSGYGLLAAAEYQKVWLGLSQSPKETFARAIQLAKKSIEIEDSPGAHRILADMYALMRKHDAAIAEAEKALELDANSSASHTILAMMLCFADRPQEALPLAKKAIRLNPYPQGVYFRNLAAIYRALGRYEEAITALKKAIHLHPNDFLAHMVLAATYSLLGREEEARAAAGEILRINPKFSLAWARKTLPYKNQAYKERVIEALRMAGMK